MKITWMSLFIVLSIILQSFVAMGGADQSHQLDAEHIQTEHSHTLDHVELFDQDSENGHNMASASITEKQQW